MLTLRFVFRFLPTDCQGVGEFVLAKSLTTDFEIQGRFVAGNRLNRHGNAVSITQGISIDVGVDDVPDVDIFAEEMESTGDCTLNFYVGGAPAKFGEDGKGHEGIEFIEDVKVCTVDTSKCCNPSLAVCS